MTQTTPPEDQKPHTSVRIEGEEIIFDYSHNTEAGDGYGWNQERGEFRVNLEGLVHLLTNITRSKASVASIPIKGNYEQRSYDVNHGLQHEEYSREGTIKGEVILKEKCQNT